jgi:hypothetical protein
MIISITPKVSSHLFILLPLISTSSLSRGTHCLISVFHLQVLEQCTTGIIPHILYLAYFTPYDFEIHSHDCTCQYAQSFMTVNIPFNCLNGNCLVRYLCHFQIFELSRMSWWLRWNIPLFLLIFRCEMPKSWLVCVWIFKYLGGPL